MVKDLYRPKGRRTAFIFFSKHCREEHRKKYPMHSIGIADISRRCGEIWKTMTDREKAPYYEMAEEDRERYENDMLAWRPGMMYPVGSCCWWWLLLIVVVVRKCPLQLVHGVASKALYRSV